MDLIELYYESNNIALNEVNSVYIPSHLPNLEGQSVKYIPLCTILANVFIIL